MSGDSPTLADVIRAGDSDAFAGFHDSRAGMVRAYAEAVCGPSRAAEAADAAFVDFLARLRLAADTAPELDDLLRQAARAAAAARMPIQRGPTCAAMPELLAAQMNHELPGDPAPIERHLSECRRCRTTAATLTRAETILQLG